MVHYSLGMSIASVVYSCIRQEIELLRYIPPTVSDVYCTVILFIYCEGYVDRNLRLSYSAYCISISYQAFQLTATSSCVCILFQWFRILMKWSFWSALRNWSELIESGCQRLTTAPSIWDQLSLEQKYEIAYSCDDPVPNLICILALSPGWGRGYTYIPYAPINVIPHLPHPGQKWGIRSPLALD